MLSDREIGKRLGRMEGHGEARGEVDWRPDDGDAEEEEDGDGGSRRPPRVPLRIRHRNGKQGRGEIGEKLGALERV